MELIIKKIEEITGLSYKNADESTVFAFKVIADHIRTAVFISADKSGIKPSNTDQGYILRRLIRRAIRHAKNLNIDIEGSGTVISQDPPKDSQVQEGSIVRVTLKQNLTDAH